MSREIFDFEITDERIYGICDFIFTEEERDAIIFAITFYLKEAPDTAWHKINKKNMKSVLKKTGTNMAKRAFINV